MVSIEEGYTHLRSFRFERKFRVEDLQPCQVETLIHLHPGMFHAPYPARYVNNLYLDTPDLDFYLDNVNGAESRCKVRVRWYGDPFGDIDRPILEIKVKKGLVGTKHSHPLPAFTLDSHFTCRSLDRVFSEASLPSSLREDLRSLEVVLFNRYFRHYFATPDGTFRLTLDSRMTFHKANGALGNQFCHRQESNGDLVVEMKYEVGQEKQADRYASFFPFRLTRNSKYSEGIQRVYF